MITVTVRVRVDLVKPFMEGRSTDDGHPLDQLDSLLKGYVGIRCNVLNGWSVWNVLSARNYGCGS